MMETLESISILPFTFSIFSYCVIQEHKWNSLEKSKGCCPELNSLLTKEIKNNLLHRNRIEVNVCKMNSTTDTIVIEREGGGREREGGERERGWCRLTRLAFLQLFW